MWKKYKTTLILTTLISLFPMVIDFYRCSHFF